jgi:hypothetical protein
VYRLRKEAILRRELLVYKKGRKYYVEIPVK